MDLDEFLFYEKKKNPSFTKKEFAKRLGVSAAFLSKIISLQQAPSAKIAYKIQKLTDGQVSGWNLIFNFYEEESKKNENRNS